MEELKLRLITLAVVNLLILIGLRNWFFHNEVFVPLLNGSASLNETTS